MLDALGNIGDFLGGIGVVVTLIYLAAQIRQSTRSSRTESYQAVATSMSELTFNLWMNPEASRLFQLGSFDIDALNPLERNQFAGLLSAMVRSLENIHYQYRTGSIDRELWVGWEFRLRGMVSAPGFQIWWSEQKGAFSPSFQALVDNQEPAKVLLHRPTAA
jgi:hypothetical protein